MYTHTEICTYVHICTYMCICISTHTYQVNKAHDQIKLACEVVIMIITITIILLPMTMLIIRVIIILTIVRMIILIAYEARGRAEVGAEADELYIPHEANVCVYIYIYI